MMRVSISITVLLVTLVVRTEAAEPKWTEPVAVAHGAMPCITFRARIEGEWLLVEMNPTPGWHSFAIDNQQRADERLAGKKSLGIEAPTKIEALSGVELVGSWYQPKPIDFSKPEMRWYTFGFDSKTLLACKIRVSAGETESSHQPVSIRVTGQACNDTSCRNIDVKLSISTDQFTVGTPQLKDLVAVKTDQRTK